MWRPENWEKIKENNRQKASEEDWEREDIFEAGANAILKALKERGRLKKGEIPE